MDIPEVEDRLGIPAKLVNIMDNQFQPKNVRQAPFSKIRHHAWAGPGLVGVGPRRHYSALALRQAQGQIWQQGVAQADAAPKDHDQAAPMSRPCT